MYDFALKLFACLLFKDLFIYMVLLFIFVRFFIKIFFPVFKENSKNIMTKKNRFIISNIIFKKLQIYALNLFCALIVKESNTIIFYLFFVNLYLYVLYMFLMVNTKEDHIYLIFLITLT